jgi:hypothetical protein
MTTPTAKEVLDMALARAAERAEKQRQSRARQCEGKVPYTNLDLAAAAIARAERNGNRPLHAYRCPHCSRFHLGHVRPERWQGSKP